MVELTLAGLSEDRTRLLLVSDRGEEFTLAVDAKLRAALRGEHARLGQLEIHMESTLRPRDIQARIRAGETPESVAQAAQTTVERILPFASPVLAERAHVAERAQRSSVRRKSGDPGARTLGEAVTAQLVPLDTSVDTVEWDAWRREDGRWTLTATYATAEHQGTGHFTFDAPGNYVIVEDDDARWLVGEAVASAPDSAPSGRDDLKRARKRRLSAVPSDGAEDELPLGDDALEIANDAPAEDTAEDSAEDAGPEVPTESEADEDGALLAESTDDADDADGEDGGDDADDAGEVGAPEDASTKDGETQESPPAPKRPRKKGRASVPSWDEIMFGGGKQE